LQPAHSRIERLQQCHTLPRSCEKARLACTPVVAVLAYSR
jgi:hypothetical protein